LKDNTSDPPYLEQCARSDKAKSHTFIPINTEKSEVFIPRNIDESDTFISVVDDDDDLSVGFD